MKYDHWNFWIDSAEFWHECDVPMIEIMWRCIFRAVTGFDHLEP